MNSELDWRGRLLLSLTRLFGWLGLIEDKWANKSRFSPAFSIEKAVEDKWKGKE